MCTVYVMYNVYVHMSQVLWRYAVHMGQVLDLKSFPQITGGCPGYHGQVAVCTLTPDAA